MSGRRFRSPVLIPPCNELFFFLNGWVSLEPAPSASARFEAFGSVAGVSSSVCAQRKSPSCGVLKIQFEVPKSHLILPMLFQALQ
jgi:hypothetical protein